MMNRDAVHCGFVAVIGLPNAGKSTFVNKVIGSKVSIVTPKVQTTRSRVMGIVMRGNDQVIFTDTPGIFLPKKRFDRAMVKAAWDGLSGADLGIFIVDAKAKNTLLANQEIINSLSQFNKPIALAINKIDLLSPDELLQIIQSFSEVFNFAKIFLISSLTGDGVKDVLDWCADHLPLGNILYPEDQITDMPWRLLAAELVREQLFMNLDQELPYNLTVETEDWEERQNGSAHISLVIYVSREGHRAIVLGKKGQKIKQIGTAARLEIQRQMERKVHLSLFVKVRENWMEDPNRYQPWGLNYKS